MKFFKHKINDDLIEFLKEENLLENFLQNIRNADENGWYSNGHIYDINGAFEWIKTKEDPQPWSRLDSKFHQRIRERRDAIVDAVVEGVISPPDRDYEVYYENEINGEELEERG